jgi:cell division protein FtsB
MTDALSSWDSRVTRFVREHEVLRVAGWLPGDNSATVANSAIEEVLRWAQRRCGGQLPPEAWEHKSFDYLSGGRNSSCVHLQSGTSDLWTIRADDPDKTVAERVWTTEVVVGLLPDQPAKFSARLLVSTPEVDLKIEPHTPGFVQQVVENCGLISGQKLLSVAPSVHETEADVEEFIDYLIEPSRKLPIFVVTLAENEQTAHPTIDTAALSRAMLGIGQVALLHPAATWRLTERFGRFKSVFGGAARVYLPGFSDDADPYIHRLVLANQLDTADGAARAVRWMRQLAAQESILRTKLGRDVLSFAAIRSANLQLRQQNLINEDASANEQLAAANDRIEALEKQVEMLGSEQDYYITEYEKERMRAELSESQAQKSAYRIQQLTEQIKAKGDDPDKDIEIPESWQELPEWCDEQLAGRLVLTPNAHRGVRNPLFKDIAIAARCLLWLASECRDQRINGGNGSINNVTIMDGIQNASCGADTYDFDWNGRRFSADWHIKNGGNTRDPSRCLRIYYCFDPQTQQIIVSDMPAHRRTGAT